MCNFAKKSKNLPKIFHVNWFRKNQDNKFLWPGFSENMRVLEWIINRCNGEVDDIDSAIGELPIENDINTEGLEISKHDLQELLSINSKNWQKELNEVGEYLNSYGERLPKELHEELNNAVDRLSK